MFELSATVVEVFAEGGVLTVHFDDRDDRYLQLQAPEDDDPAETKPGYGSVHVEVGSQLRSVNCFSEAELHRDRFRLVLARDAAMAALGEAVARFDLDDTAYEELRAGLARVFRRFPGFRVVQGG